MSRSMNNESETQKHNPEENNSGKEIISKCIKENNRSVLEEAICYVQGTAKRELLMHLP